MNPLQLSKGKGPLAGLLNMNLDWFLDNIKETTEPVERFFANYRCAIMEIETKFNVLDEQFSIKYDANPIE